MFEKCFQSSLTNPAFIFFQSAKLSFAKTRRSSVQSGPRLPGQVVYQSQPALPCSPTLL